MRKLLLIISLIVISFNVRSQCTQVCIKGGTVTSIPAGTETVIIASPKGEYTVTTSYTLIAAPGTQAINAGALSVSVSNVGANEALFNGATLPPGATVNILIPNATLPKYTYNALTSSLMILVNR